MKEERMKVLELIENGIISAQEGIGLLEALRESDTTREKFDRAVKKTGEFANTAKDKICEFAKDKEPVVKETVGNIANTVGEIAEGVGKAIKSVITNDGEVIDPVEEEVPDEEASAEPSEPIEDDSEDDVIDL